MEQFTNILSLPIGIQSQIDHIVKLCALRKPLAVIKCFTYNHKNYLRDALQSFVEQQTSFPFVVIVHDDASTDETTQILEEYTAKYPSIILPIIETENQYSKRTGAVECVFRKALSVSGAKYVALCEGDDYWTDPFKLQKQVSFLESHPDYSMCVTNAKAVNTVTNQIAWEYNISNEDSDLGMSDMIMRGGGFLPTATFVYRVDSYNQMPKEIFNLYVGDYPLQIWMRFVGNVRFIKDQTAVYRVGGGNSWTDRNENCEFGKRKEFWEKHHTLLEVMNKCTQYKYDDYFKRVEKEFQFYDCVKYKQYSLARRLWWQMGFPIKKYGWHTFFEIIGLASLYKRMKQIKG